ncbi:uncharacterized protein LOC124293417 [Neodiprion lecontei]|uniref:Uncharacterized protein LOC124293417 n=1 Tax=Neodiprion lecontei TaxID=441921 RepID=A0ABM3FQC5_NEOLC|nr:uncharacterized protein LOC124293417 [Neodiprion lecontei]
MYWKHFKYFSALKALRDGTTESVETLAALKRPVDKWDNLLVYLTVLRFDPTTRRDWETHLGASTRPSTYEELDDFLQGRIQALEHVEQSTLSTLSNFPADKPTNASKRQPASQPKVHTLASVKVKSSCCSFCKQLHYIARCDKFREINVDDRNAFAVSSRLCFNFLGTHLLRVCRSSGTCGTCRGKHHTLLHGATISSSSSTSPVNPPSSSFTPSVSDSQGHQPPTEVSANVVHSNPKIQCSTWLATARVNIILDDGRESKLRALIDPCSGASFIAESAVQRLNMPRRSAFVPVPSIVATRDQTARSKVSVSLTSQYDKSKK